MCDEEVGHFSLPLYSASVYVDIISRKGYPLHQTNHKRGDKMEAYCMKCRAKKEMVDAKAITMKNGKPATQGVCPVCGTKMFRIGKN